MQALIKNQVKSELLKRNRGVGVNLNLSFNMHRKFGDTKTKLQAKVVNSHVYRRTKRYGFRKHTITLKTITPLLMHGANPREMAESRETSFKGVIRYWWRVLQLNSSELLQEETRLSVVEVEKMEFHLHLDYVSSCKVSVPMLYVLIEVHLRVNERYRRRFND